MRPDWDSRIDVAYFAPGAGLGHLNRALAICLCLREEFGVEAVRVVTDSPYAAGVAARMRCTVVRLQQPWTSSAREFVRHTRPRLLVADTFPQGMHGELLDAGVPVVHVARRLQTPFPMPPDSLRLSIVAEPLADSHRAALHEAGPCVVLDGPIVLTHVPPPALDVPAIAGADTLIVHSGSEAEVRQLEAMAGKDSRTTVISPRFGVDCYPVTHLFDGATRILTGAGYNLMAELLPYREKHTAVAFARRFDDQQARLRHFFAPGSQPATAVAAQAIADLL